MAFLPELVLLAGALGLFVLCLDEKHMRLARPAAMVIALATLIASILSLGQQAVLFAGAYRIDAFSQWLKVVFAAGFLLTTALARELPDLRPDVKSEYYLFLNLSVTGLTFLVSSLDLITLIVALELSSFPLFFLVAMRKERDGQRIQMESAIKYVVFGITATGVTLFGMGYVFALTGSTSLPVVMAKIKPLTFAPLAITGLTLMMGAVLYKLAVFPFHFWTPDVYQGAAHPAAGLIASLPKVGAAAVLVRFASLATPQNHTIALILTCLAVASMFYGNLIALQQTDMKRLLGFSGIAHAGYAVVGFVTLDTAGYTASLYYLVGYLFMVLSCFVVLSAISKDGENVGIEDLAGLHARSPLLALTLVVGVVALAGVPPFAGFMGKLSLLKAALSKGHLALVILVVINTAIAIYYYLGMVREACFRDPEGRPAIALDGTTRVLCLVLVALILLLGVAPGSLLESIASSAAHTTSASTVINWRP